MRGGRGRRYGAPAALLCLLALGCGDDGDRVAVDAEVRIEPLDLVEPESEPEVVEPEPEVVEPETVEPEPETVEPEPEVVEPEPETVEPEPETVEPEPDVNVGDTADTIEDSTEPLDDDLVPCDHPERWPFSILSSKVPVRVHYRAAGDAGAAREILDVIEHAWHVEVDQLGFEAPLADDGRCGDDAAIDVFTWRDAPEVFVDLLEDNDATPWDDGYPYMVVDPWGEFGGDELGATLAHELNHMCQAVHDWSDAAFIYEATSTFIEDLVYDDHDSYQELLFDFQGNPDWSLDRDDGYETWYMYGAALWLHFLRERYFRGDARFIAELWRGLRSGWDDNEPDFADSLDVLLAREGASYADSVVELARWRWYVGARDDGRHLEEAGAFPRDAQPAVTATLEASGGEATLRPMLLGTSYVDVVQTAEGESTFMVALETSVPPGEVHWVVQALPGIDDGSDGEVLSLPASVRLVAVDGKVMRTLAITALPGLDGDIDPDSRSDQRFRASMQVTAP